VGGTGERQYSPNRAVTRVQMATFIVKALGAVTGSEPQSDDDAFDDDEDSVHEASINALASLGVVTGTGDRTYSPALAVSREAMASFIARAADYLAEQGHWPDLPASGGPTYEVTPDSEAAFSNGQTRTFSVAVEAGTVVDIRLFPTDDVEIAGDVIRFRDDAGPSGRADENVSAAQIIQVDGDSVNSAQQVSDVTSDGSLEFVVRSTQDADITPVVWADPAPADGGNQSLDLLETREPSEAFGIGGRTLFVPGESSAGQSTPTVRTVSTGLDLFVSTASVTYYYDDNDTFQLKGVAISLAEFEAMLSGGDAQPPDKGDVLSVNYQMEPQFTSVFNITEDN
ncbi:MAG: S-layer homology domain-containing protein, partial [Nitriliruptorales bacterium]